MSQVNGKQARQGYADEQVDDFDTIDLQDVPEGQAPDEHQRVFARHVSTEKRLENAKAKCRAQTARSRANVIDAEIEFLKEKAEGLRRYADFQEARSK